MTLPAEIIVIVLLAALFHASWNAVVKIGGDRLAVLTLVNVAGGGIGLVILALVPLPRPASWPFLLASMCIHTGYYLALVRAYEVGDLSHVYPLARGVSPLMVTGGAAWLAGELPTPLALAGVAVACAGIVSLAFDGGPPWRSDARPLGYALLTGVLIASYSVTDGMGVRRSGHELAYIAWLFFLDALPIGCITAWLRRRELVRVVHREWRKVAAGGALQFGAYGLVIWAMNHAAMGAVSALRETSVVFAALIGTLLLGERFGAMRVAAAVAVAAGLVLMRLG